MLRTKDKTNEQYRDPSHHPKKSRMDFTHYPNQAYFIVWLKVFIISWNIRMTKKHAGGKLLCLMVLMDVGAAAYFGVLFSH